MLLLIWQILCQVLKEFFWSDEAFFPASPTLESIVNFFYWKCWKRWTKKTLHWYDVGEHLVCLSKPSFHVSKGVVLIIPGMNGDNKCHYVEQFIHDVAIPKDLDVYVVKKSPARIGMYGDMTCIREGLKTLRERNLVSGNVKLGLVGISAGAIPMVKYIAKYDDVNYALAIGCGFDLNKIDQSLSEAWSYALYYCLSHKFDKLLQEHDNDRAAREGYANLEDFYKDHSCHEYLNNATVPLHIICSYDDPVVYTDHFAHVHQCAKSNANIKYYFSRYGGHLGWRCGTWLRKTLLQEVYPHI